MQDGIAGPAMYDVKIALLASRWLANAATYNPTPHFAYLVRNNGPFGEEDGSFPGAIYRNVWIGMARGRRRSGSALEVVR